MHMGFHKVAPVSLLLFQKKCTIFILKALSILTSIIKFENFLVSVRYYWPKKGPKRFEKFAEL